MDERLDVTHPISQVELQLHTSRYRYAFEAIQKHTSDKNIKILDIACGTGYGTTYLAKKTKTEVIGIDIDKKTVRKAEQKYGNKKTIFQQGILQHIQFPARTFDVVVCFETIEHVSKQNGQKGLRELYRVLKPGGLLILSSPNRSCTNVMKRFMSTYHNKHHLHEYVKKELINTVQRVGFTRIHACGQYLFIPPIYLLADKTNFLNWFFKPYDFLPAILCRYILLTATKERNVDRLNKKN